MKQESLKVSKQKTKNTMKSIKEILKNDQTVNNLQFLIEKKKEIEDIHEHRKKFSRKKRLEEQERINKAMYFEKHRNLS